MPQSSTSLAGNGDAPVEYAQLAAGVAAAETVAGTAAVSAVLRDTQYRAWNQIPASQRGVTLARLDTLARRLPTAATAPAAASVNDPLLPGAEVPLTIFRSANGLLTKEAALDKAGALRVTPSAKLSTGDFRTVHTTFAELPAVIAALGPNEAICVDVARNGAVTGPVATVKAIAEGRALAGAVARTPENFGPGAGPGLWPIDADTKDMPDAQRPNTLADVRTRLIAAVPALSSAAMVMLPSAGACLYRSGTGEVLRGLTGVRGYVLVENPARIPELTQRLHQRLILGGNGWAFVSKAGTIRVRSMVDTSVAAPARLLFDSGAKCGPGVEQRRGVAEVSNPNAAPLILPAIPALSDAERVAHDRMCSDIRNAAKPNAARVRVAWEAQQRAAGRTVSASYSPDGAVEYLNGDHTIELTDGRLVTVNEILGNPESYHAVTCADPMEPDYAGGDKRIACIYANQPTPVINSNAHGGTKYVLRASAAVDFSDAPPEAIAIPSAEPATVAPVPQNERSRSEQIASLLNDADRAAVAESRTWVPGMDLVTRYNALTAAANTFHPLHPIFQQALQKISGVHADEEARFKLLAAARLSRESFWINQPVTDRQLMINAAFVLLAPYNVLDGTSQRTPRRVERGRASRSWFLDRMLPVGGVGALVSQPNVGKTQILSVIADAVGAEPVVDGLGVSQPARLLGSDVPFGSVLYCATEDATGVDETIVFRGAQHGRTQHVTVIEGGPNLSSLSDTVRFLRGSVAIARDGKASSPPFALFVFDVFRECFTGDENSSEVVSAAMSVARIVAAMFGVTILIAHHAGRGDAERARGSIAFDAALDFIGVLTAPAPATIALRITKNRAGPKGESYAWHFDGAGCLADGRGVIDSANDEAPADTVGRVVHELTAATNQPVVKTDLYAALAADTPAAFGDGVPTTVLRSRRSRAIVGAARARYITLDKHQRIRPGPNTPVLLPPGGALEVANVR